MKQVNLDLEALQKLRKLGSDKLVVRMVNMFLELGPQRVETGRNALRDGDAATAERSFHSLRSSSANVGALEASRQAALLENRIRGGDLEVDEDLALLQELMDASVSALQAELARIQSPAAP